MEHTTRADATTLSLTAELLRSSRHAETPSHGSQATTVPSPGTTRSARQNIWIGRFGGTGAATTAEAASRPILSDVATQYPAGQRMHCMKLLGQRLMARHFDP